MRKRKKKSQHSLHTVEKQQAPMLEETLSEEVQGEFAQQLEALFQQELGEGKPPEQTAPRQSAPDEAYAPEKQVLPRSQQMFVRSSGTVSERKRVSPAPASAPILPSAGSRTAAPVAQSRPADQGAEDRTLTVTPPAPESAPGFTYEQADDLFAAIDDLLDHRSFLDQRRPQPEPAPEPEPPAPQPEPPAEEAPVRIRERASEEKPVPEKHAEAEPIATPEKKAALRKKKEPERKKEKRSWFGRTARSPEPIEAEAPATEPVIRDAQVPEARMLSDEDLFAAIDDILGDAAPKSDAAAQTAPAAAPEPPAPPLYHTRKEQLKQNTAYWGQPKTGEARSTPAKDPEDLSLEGQVSLTDLLQHFGDDEDRVAVAPVSRDTNTDLTTLFKPDEMEPPAIPTPAAPEPKPENLPVPEPELPPAAPIPAAPEKTESAAPSPIPAQEPAPHAEPAAAAPSADLAAPAERPTAPAAPKESTSAPTEPKEQPAVEQAEPAAHSADKIPAGEELWEEEEPAEEPKPARPGFLARLKALVSGGLYADEEELEEEEPDTPAPPKPKSKKEAPAPHKEHGLTLEDFMAVAVPMEEAEKPLHQQAVAAVLEQDRERERIAAQAEEKPEPAVAAEPAPETPEPQPGPAAEPTEAEPVPSAAAKRRVETAAPAQRPPEVQKPKPKPRPRPQPVEPERPARRRRRPVPEQVVLRPEEASRKIGKELSSVGTRIIVLAFFEVIALFFTFYLARGWSFLPTLFSGGATSYILLLLLAAMTLTARELYTDFFRRLSEGSFTLTGLIGLATVMTGLDCFGAARNGRTPFTAVVGVLLLVALWGKYTGGMGYLTTLRILREEDARVGIVEVPDITQGRRGLIRSDPDVEQFMAKLETRDLLSKIMSVYAPVACGVVLVGTVALSLACKVNLFWAGTLLSLGAVPMAGLLAYERLFYLISRRLAQSRAALCGYHGAEVFGGDHAILVSDEDLFPEGSLALNGFKVYSGNPDRIIAYAAAATRRSGSALFPLFDQLLEEHNGRHYSVDSFRFYDSGGIGAEIIGDVILLGSLEFMRRMGVHMDSGTKVRQAVYVSVNGELGAVFAVKYNPPKEVQKGLASIARNRHFKTILVTRTFLGTPSFLKSKFGIPTASLFYPPTRERLRLSEAEMTRQGAQGALLTRDSFVGFAEAAAGGRVLRSATALACFLALLGGLAGLVLMGVLVSLPAYETATAVNLLWYTLMWLIPTLLLSGWARHY